MLLYFDRNGQLLEYLEYDDAARVGTTEFKLFAYFEGLDNYTLYSNATIRFKKPDLDETEYPDLFMVKHTLNFDASIEESEYFSSEHGPYHGFIFDFGSIIIDDNEPVKLLDTPGIWEASVTLQSASRSNVTGLVKFTVENAVSDVDDFETEVDASAIVNNIRVLLVNDYVPYEGANKDLNLGEHALKFGENVSIFEENGSLRIVDANGEFKSISESDIPNFQNNTAIIVNPVININGWNLSNFRYTNVNISGYPAYKITDKENHNLTEDKAKIYMECMCGSRFLPIYNYYKPQYTFFITAAGELLKPQYDSTNGLLLYKVTNPFVTETQLNAAINEALGTVENELDDLDVGEGV